MISLLRKGLVAAAITFASTLPMQAQSLRVSPVTLDVQAPGAATSLTIRNEGRDTMTVQARSFRWTQQGGKESLQRTGDVVVSPPAVRLPPGATQIIRVVRTSKAPVRGEEAYRIIINEVPDQARRRGGAVNFATELRIPVFFSGRGASNPAVAWSLRNAGNATYLVAQNQGDTRLRLADLTLAGASGASVSHPGLVGYVLGGATMQWPVAAAGRLGAGARMKAQTNLGAVDAGIAAH